MACYSDEAADVRSRWLMSNTVRTAQRGDLPRSTPEEQGVSSDLLRAFYDTLLNVRQIDIHGVVIMRHGKVISELYPKPYRKDSRLTLYSVSKTFTGLAVGIAADMGLIDINMPVTEYLDLQYDKLQFTLDESQESRAKSQDNVPTVRDLLTMRSGIVPDWTLRDTTDLWTLRMFEKPRDSIGVRYGYDSMVTYLLSQAVQNVTGKTMIDFLEERLFRPLGISGATWEVSPEGYNTGGWGLMLTNEDLAKVGQLLLQLGNWGGRQVVSRQWMAQMMSAQSNNGKSDYGYQIWVNPDGMSYRADGALGQYILVHPKQDMVCVITSCTQKSPVSAASLWWQYVTAKPMSDAALAPDTIALDRLRDREAFASLRMTGGLAKSPLLKPNVELNMKINDADSIQTWRVVSVAQGGRSLRLTLLDAAGKKHAVYCGYGYWRDNHVFITPPYYIKARNRLTTLTRKDYRVSGCYGFTSPEDLYVQLQFTNFGTRYDTHVKMNRK